MVHTLNSGLSRGRQSAAIVLLASLFLIACTDKRDTAPAQNLPPAQSLSAGFAGKWQVARPDLAGVIVNVPTASCDAPVVITQYGPGKIVRTSPKGEPLPLMLNSIADDRIVWMPEDNSSPYSFIAESKTADKFWLYTVHIGKADWDDPREYLRCP